MIRKKYLSLIIILTVIVNLLLSNPLSVNAQIKSPVITGVKPAVTGVQDKIYFTQPLITGLTSSGTEVLIYIDGTFIDYAQINKEQTEADNFYYQVKTHLISGEHVVMAIARDKTSLVLSAPSTEEIIIIKNIPAPTLVAPNEKTITGKVKPAIVGLTVSGTFVHIYIDGIYNGKTKVVEHKSGTANFVYYPFLNLNIGKHEIKAVAEDKLGRKSQPTTISKFSILPAQPAPIIFSPKTIEGVVSRQPFLTGLAKNDSIIKIFIDKKLYKEFKVKNHKSGTANFAYKPAIALTNGKHFAYTIAYDDHGKESIWSNIIYFNVGRTIQPTITPIAAVDKNKNEIGKPDVTEKKSTENQKDQDIETILKTDKAATSTNTGLINERKTLQSKFQLNLIIFILFLIAVILWIIWVNRELIKEKREQFKNGKTKTDL